MNDYDFENDAAFHDFAHKTPGAIVQYVVICPKHGGGIGPFSRLSIALDRCASNQEASTFGCLYSVYPILTILGDRLA